MEDIVIVSAARTGVGKFGGSLANRAKVARGTVLAVRRAVEKAGTPIAVKLWPEPMGFTRVPSPAAPAMSSAMA